MKRFVPLLFLALVPLVGYVASVSAARQAPALGPSYRFVKVTDDIYAAIGTGATNVGANSAIIINDQDVMVVDSHISPASMRALVDELKTITPKPIRYVVNTHYHYDHAHGNQIFGPEVEVIGHEFTRRELLEGKVMEQDTYQSAVVNLPAQIESLRTQIAGEKDPAQKIRLEGQLARTLDFQAGQREVRPTPPNVTVASKMTLFKGAREIQLLYLGRGHTGGDLVVYLPKERVICTGDLQTASLSYMGDGFLDEWPRSLEALKALDFDTVIPGHGDVFTGKERITGFQRYLEDFWTKAAALKKAGVPADQAAARMDLTSHKDMFPQVTRPAGGEFILGVKRAYKLLADRGM